MLSRMITDREVILLGTCARAHGKQGELQVHSDRDLLPDAGEVSFVVIRMDNILTPFRLLSWREKGADAYVLSLEGIDTEEKAQHLCGRQIYLLRRDLTDDPGEELLTWEDLVGYELQDRSQGRLGTIQDVDDSTLNTLFLLDSGAMLPAHEDFIVGIDQRQRILHVDMPAGLV